MTENRFKPLLCYAPLLVMGAYLLAFFALGDFDHVLSRVPDDAAYYFKIAENIASGAGATFDGIHKTNGYQPLWLVCLLPIAALKSGDPAVMFRIYLCFETLVVALAAYFFFTTYSRIFSRPVTFFSVAVFSVIVFFQAAIGMETGLLLLLIALMFWYAFKLNVFSTDAPGAAFGFGVLTGLMMLARLDMVFLGVAVGAFCFLRIFHGDTRTGWIRFGLMGLGAVVIVAPYLIYNVAAFGHVVPIAGILKSSFPHLSVSAAKLRTIGWPHVSFAGAAVLYVAWSLAVPRREPSAGGGARFFHGAMVLLAVAVVLHFLDTLLFIHWALQRWHFIPYALFAAFVLTEPLVYAAKKFRRLRPDTFIVVAGLGFFIGGGKAVLDRTFLSSVQNSWLQAAYQAALWTRDHTDPGDVFAMKDAGDFSYFSERRVINLDGVVNNLEYQEVLRSRVLADYLAGAGTKYLVQHAFWPTDAHLSQDIRGGSGDILSGDYESIVVRYKSEQFGVYSDDIVLGRSSEVYRALYDSERYPGKKDLFAIWALSRPSAEAGE